MVALRAFPPLEVDEPTAERLRAFAAEPERFDELALCHLATQGNSAAQAQFEARFIAPLSADDEVKQVVRHKLLLAGKLAEFAGRGELSRWVKAVAARVAVDLKRAQREETVEARVLDAMLGKGQPELDALARQARQTLQEAVRAALDSLTDRERLFIQHYHLDGMTLQAIGDLYGVVPSTVMRALDRAKEQLGTLARRHLAEKHGLGADSIDSLVRAVQSHFEP